jgi:hypothetical protein
MERWQCGYSPLVKCSISDSKIVAIHLHLIQTEIGGVEGRIKVLPGKLETLPNAEEVIVEIAEDVGLPVCIGTETFELERGLGE